MTKPLNKDICDTLNNAHNFYQAVGDADVIVVSFVEHNGIYTAAYKNVFHWTPRIDKKVL
ncbi:NAD(P)H-dependent oxidoreductase [Pseudoalteromonas maricaloris]|uniref:NAD(P)H-dependent oxidoreductase n=1 Tax=Pseudoalteromonas maricaloris TaxID=184924 RepID=UPI003C1B4761